ncbi:MAG: hypothetical protein [Inoviridae sp.]|nr:MAG: hypothetical protein [Inoviridae sp.]
MRPVITSTGGILRKAQPVGVACLRQEVLAAGRAIRAAKTGLAEEGVSEPHRGPPKTFRRACLRHDTGH